MDGSSPMPGGGDDGSIARVAGNRAGIVEWANDAFSRLTGIALAETVDKPVTRFLERAGIEIEVVDFVAQHFFEGRPCRLEFPYERPDGRRIEILLEVEPLRDAEGEIDRFRAMARERGPASSSASSRADAPGPIPASDPSAVVEAAGPPFARALLPEPRAMQLGEAIRRVVAAETGDDRTSHPDGETWLLDLDLSEELLSVRAAEDEFAALTADLLQAARGALAQAGHGWGVITLSTGRTTPRRRFRSKVHAIPAYPPELADTSRIYLEIHDTGAPLAADAIASLLGGDELRSPSLRTPDGATPVDAREAALARAVARARALGASIHLDATPGCGNQALVLFPA